MEVLYTAEEAAAIGRKASRFRTAMLAAGAAGLAVCVGLCFFVNTANAGALQAAAIAASTLAGWAVILTWALGYAPAHAAHAHMEGVLTGPAPEEYTGRLQVEDGARQIPKSIWIRRVTLTRADGGTESLSVLAEKAGALPSPDAEVRVRTVRKYIVAWGVPHDSE